MDADKIDGIVRSVVIWGLGAVAVALAAQKYIF